uniref:Uncharacterized protein n=1 Tax=Glossina austeni TaxID=7395 RepID=A0A1A9VLD3_GLOAU
MVAYFALRVKDTMIRKGVEFNRERSRQLLMQEVARRFCKQESVKASGLSRHRVWEKYEFPLDLARTTYQARNQQLPESQHWRPWQHWRLWEGHNADDLSWSTSTSRSDKSDSTIVIDGKIWLDPYMINISDEEPPAEMLLLCSDFSSPIFRPEDALCEETKEGATLNNDKQAARTVELEKKTNTEKNMTNPVEVPLPNRDIQLLFTLGVYIALNIMANELIQFLWFH